MADSSDYSIFVGDLAPDVSDEYLQSFFQQYFPSVRSAKVITDPATARSKGYGFVRFGSESERDRALTEMNGVFISTRAIRVSIATAKRNTSSGGGATPPPSTAAASSASTATHSADTDPTNTTLFIGGLSASVTEDQLRSIFGRYGDIIYTKIPQGKGCGFVQFVDRKAAEYAMQEMNGMVIGNSAVRISWGRSNTKATQGHVVHATATPGYSYAYPVGYAYDPAYSYGMYAADPYGGYSYAGMDPYRAYSPYGMMPGPAGYAHPAAGALGAHAAGTVPSIYDPLAPVNVDKMNALYMHRRMPVLTGSFLRMPM